MQFRGPPRASTQLGRTGLRCVRLSSEPVRLPVTAPCPSALSRRRPRDRSQNGSAQSLARRHARAAQRFNETHDSRTGLTQVDAGRCRRSEMQRTGSALKRVPTQTPPRETGVGVLVGSGPAALSESSHAASTATARATVAIFRTVNLLHRVLLARYRTSLASPLPFAHHGPPNGWRVSGEPRGEAEERVRCTRGLGHTLMCHSPPDAAHRKREG